MRERLWRLLYRVLAVFAIVSMLTGCATARGDAVTALNAASDLAALVEPKLEALDKQEQEACLVQPAASRQACVAGVRARYSSAWAAYRKFQAAWMAGAASVRSYDALTIAGKNPNATTILATVTTLAEAEQAFATAAAALGAS